MELFHRTRNTLPSEIYNGAYGFDMTFSTSGMWGIMAHILLKMLHILVVAMFINYVDLQRKTQPFEVHDTIVCRDIQEAVKFTLCTKIG
jgi:uncharacterized membrane protein